MLVKIPGKGLPFFTQPRNHGLLEMSQATDFSTEDPNSITLVDTLGTKLTPHGTIFMVPRAGKFCPLEGTGFFHPRGWGRSSGFVLCRYQWSGTTGLQKAASTLGDLEIQGPSMAKFPEFTIVHARDHVKPPVFFSMLLKHPLPKGLRRLSCSEERACLDPKKTCSKKPLFLLAVGPELSGHGWRGVPAILH